jgi:transporter family-2 protein
VIGGLVGAVQVYVGLTLVNKVGAGPFMGFTVTAALITSLVIDHFGWFRMKPHPLNVWRTIGGLQLVAGVSLIARFLRRHRSGRDLGSFNFFSTSSYPAT